VQVF